MSRESGQLLLKELQKDEKGLEVLVRLATDETEFARYMADPDECLRKLGIPLDDMQKTLVTTFLLGLRQRTSQSAGRSVVNKLIRSLLP